MAKVQGSDEQLATGEPTFVEVGGERFRTILKEASDYRALSRTPYGLRPIIFFTLVLVVGAFDGAVFGQAAPEILRDLGIDILPIFNALAVIGFFLVLINLGLGFLADRVRRVPFVAFGTFLGGLFSIVTTFAKTPLQLGLSRGGDSLGGSLAGAPAGSLTADYYPVEVRGKVFAISGVLGRAVGLATPLVIAWLVTSTSLSWRLPYLITGPLLMVIGLTAFLFLKEPVRGYMERRAAGLSDDEARIAEEPVSFGEAWRTIWSIRTVRRLFISEIPGSGGTAIFGFFFALFLFEHYNLDITERAYIGTAFGVATLPFGFLAGGLIDVLTRRRPQRVLVMTGVLGVAASLFLFVVAMGPPLVALIPAVLLFAGAGALLGPAREVLFLQIVPAHVRNLAAAIMPLASLPGTIARVLAVNYVFDRWGVQGGLFVAVPFILVQALIALSAAGFFERDLRAAIASQLASREWRIAKAEGRDKLLVCRAVDVEYDGVQVLFDVDFDVEEGEIVALLGTNGAGKSTLLRAISGTQEASSGAIVCDGRDITHMPPHEVAARGVVHMPGGRGVFPGLTVRENLALGAWLLPPDEQAAEIERVYELFGVLRERADERGGTLSGGEQQMLSLAQAFLSRPKLLMIDELSLGLAPAIVAQLLELVREINKRGTTIIIVEQSVNIALTIAQRAIFLEKGAVRFVGPTADLLSRPDILRAVYVRGTGAVSARPPARRRRTFGEEAAAPALELQGLVRRYGTVTAVDGVSFDLPKGSVIGLIGPNGAGKTTLFDLISGYQLPDLGTVLLDGEDVTTLDPEARAKRGLIRRFQDAKLVGALTVFENLLVSLELTMDVRNALLGAAQVPRARRAERRARGRADRLIELFELGAYRDKFVKDLSTGLRRIVDVACTLAAEPKVLLLDEPSAGIAQAEAESLAPLLRRVLHETGCSMLIIEHDMPLISTVSDELIALHLGAVIARGAPSDVLNDERVVQSYLGTKEDVIQRSGRIR